MIKINLINLDQCVLNALHLFTKTKLPPISFNFKRPLVVGSGNALVTGKIVFEDKDAVFADEGDYKEKLKIIKNIDGAILISASGGKHAPIIAKELKKRKIKTILLTNNPDALARPYIDKTIVFPKQPEPYTYNTSTYLGMILAKTKENPRTILNHIQKIKPKMPTNLHRYNAFCIIIPPKFELIREMFLTKFDELFGPMVLGRVFTSEQIKHAKTVVPSDKELFIGLGIENKIYGKQRLNVALPSVTNYALVMAAGYYIIGHIQKQHPPYFRKNIADYARKTSIAFHQKIKSIVD